MSEDRIKILSAINEVKSRLAHLNAERQQLTEDLKRLNIKLEKCRGQSNTHSHEDDYSIHSVHIPQSAGSMRGRAHAGSASLYWLFYSIMGIVPSLYDDSNNV